MNAIFLSRFPFILNKHHQSLVNQVCKTLDCICLCKSVSLSLSFTLMLLVCVCFFFSPAIWNWLLVLCMMRARMQYIFWYARDHYQANHLFSTIDANAKDHFYWYWLASCDWALECVPCSLESTSIIMSKWPKMKFKTTQNITNRTLLPPLIGVTTYRKIKFVWTVKGGCKTSVIDISNNL